MAGSRPRDLFILSVFLLVTIGLVMVFSAGYYRSAIRHDSPYFLFYRQLLWCALGVLALWVLADVDYRIIRRIYPFLFAVTILMLVLVMIPGVGMRWKGSSRWLPVGNFQFQPSEIAKVTVILFIAGYLAGNPERRTRLGTGFLPLGIGVGVVVGLVVAEPDLGTSAFILAVSVILMLVAGVPVYYLAGAGCLAVPPILYVVLTRLDHVIRRFEGMFSPENVYQIRQSLGALASGGIPGVGIGAGQAKMGFLPECYGDFIFAVIGEELGFIGALAVVSLYLLLLWSGVRIALRAPDSFGFLVAMGIVVAIGLQAAFNMAVVTGSAPTKGIPMPFITFGGSGLCVGLAEAGVLLSIEKASRVAREVAA